MKIDLPENVLSIVNWFSLVSLVFGLIEGKFFVGKFIHFLISSWWWIGWRKAKGETNL